MYGYCPLGTEEGLWGGLQQRHGPGGLIGNYVGTKPVTLTPPGNSGGPTRRWWIAGLFTHQPAFSIPTTLGGFEGKDWKCNKRAASQDR